jgi:uncharacterized membrane protein
MMKEWVLRLDAHYKLAIAGTFTALVALLTGNEGSVSVGLLRAWIAFAGAMLVMIGSVVLLSEPARMRAAARLQDAGRLVILSLVTLAACGSLALVASLLHTSRSGEAAGSGLITYAAAVLLSWCLIHALLTLHYAHIYYGDHRVTSEQHAGLAFPGGHQPDYPDFLYFSLTIGMTCQVSDVVVTSRRLRRLVLVHGLVSFFFNTVVLALTVSVLAAGVF